MDPESTIVRPSARVIVGPNEKHFPKLLKHDDLIIVPEFGCPRGDLSTYYTLVEEMRCQQAEGRSNSEWKAWNEGTHLITSNPSSCPTYKGIVKRMCEYFKID